MWENSLFKKIGFQLLDYSSAHCKLFTFTHYRFYQCRTIPAIVCQHCVRELPTEIAVYVTNFYLHIILRSKLPIAVCSAARSEIQSYLRCHLLYNGGVHLRVDIDVDISY